MKNDKTEIELLKKIIKPGDSVLDIGSNIGFYAKILSSFTGETGKVLMIVPIKKALIIPQKATYEIQDKKYVFVVDKNSVVKSREIKITGALPDLYVIKSGITTSDKILLEGVQKATDDEKIKYDYQKPKEVLSHLKLNAE